ncbi:MAG: BamA/TamA family outer membrane protein [Sandaracinaceae bacterium]|nr:BamA/TamA family outer membrane protein [Sandaracinaceae bacterium]
MQRTLSIALICSLLLFFSISRANTQDTTITHPAEEKEDSPEDPPNTPSSDLAWSHPNIEGHTHRTSESQDESPCDREKGVQPISYWLEGIRVLGNQRTEERVIRRHLALKEGDMFLANDERIEQSRYQLLGTGFFSEVRLWLERGSSPGKAILVVEVKENFTFRIDQLGIGISQGLSGMDARAPPPLMPYLGITLFDPNFIGTGNLLNLAILLSEAQQGARLHFESPDIFDARWGLALTGFFLNGKEYFGDNDVLVTPLRCPDLRPTDPCEAARAAVVSYVRGGGALGTGTSISPFLRLRLAYHLEAISVLSMPDAASEVRGTEIVPVNFHVQRGLSAIAFVDVSLTLDERDASVLAQRGSLLHLRVQLASRLYGSDHDFFRAEGLARHWIPLPGLIHTLRLGAYAGATLGDTPFFYRFYASDLSDLIPSRMLEMSVDRRGPLNLLRTAISEQRTGQLAGRADIEYQIELFHWDSDLRGLWLFLNGGVYLLSDFELFYRPIPGYSGLSGIPIDLTFDFGVRLSTSIGVFTIGFSTLLGFVSIE